MGLQFRRGTDSDRLGITPDIGEPLYTTNNKKLYIGDGVTAGGVLVSGDVSDSAGVIVVINQTVDSNYVQERQIVGPDASAVSNIVVSTVDSAYVQARQADIFRDSAFVTNIIDTAYIQARDRIRDSGFVEDIADSAYVQSRQDFAYSSLTGAPTNVSSFTNDANYLDSTTVTGVIDAAYVQSNQITYNTSDFVDSAYVTTQINNLVDGAPVALDTLNELAIALQNDSDALASLITVVDTKLNTAGVTSLVDSAYVQARQTTYDFLDSAEAIALIATQGYLTNTLDSAEVTAIVDTAYIQARQTPQDFAYGSLTDAPTNLSQFNNDTNYLDSTTVTGVIDASYIQSNQTTYDFLDSFEVIGLIDSAYINLRTDANIDSAALIALVDSAYVQARQAPGTDSSEVQNIITEFVDSAYVQLRQTPQDFAYSSLTGVPNVLDSAAVAEILPDGTFRGLRTYTFTADSGDTSFSGTDDNGNSLTYSSNSLVVYANGILLVPTTDYTATDGSTITLTIAADSADVITAHNIVAGGTDSALINQEIIGLIDSAYIQARETAQDFAYSSLTGAPTTVSTFTNDANYLDSTTVTGVIDATYIQSNQTTYDFLDSAEAIALIATQGYLTDALDSAEVVGLIDSAYVQARQSNADQDLNTTDSVEFAALEVTGNVVIGGNLQVDGTQTVINTENLSVEDNMFYLNQLESAGTPTLNVDVGWAANVNDDGSYEHVGMFRDATDNTFKIFEKYTPEPDAASQINTAHASFSLAPFAARTLAGEYLGFDSDFNTKTISDLANDANYLDSTTVQGVIDATYIQANQTTYTVLDSADVSSIIAATDLVDSTDVANIVEAYGYLTSAIDSTGVIALITANDQQRDSAFVTGIIDSAYINARVSATDSAAVVSIVTGTIDSAYINARVDAVAGTDSAATIALIQATVDSAYVAAREANAGGSGGTDSATVISLTQATVDSDYVLARIPDATLQGVNQFEFIGDSGQTVFTGTDRDGNGLNYNSTDVLVFLNGTLMVPGNDFVTTNSSTITFTEGVDSGDFVNIFNFTAGRAVGGGVSEVNHFDFTADSGQATFTGTDNAGSTLSFIGNDNIQVFINGILLKQSDYTTTNNNTVTLGIAADSADEVRIIAYDTYSQRVAIDDYNFTADSGQTIFTGTDDDGNALSFAPGNLQVHLNGIMLRSGNDYSTTGSGTVTLVSGADSGDTLTVTAISGDSAGYQTIVTSLIDSAYINARVDAVAGTDSAATIALIESTADSAYVQLRQTAQDFAYSSLTGVPNVLDSTNVSSIVTSYGYSTFDSADVRTTRWSDNERLIMGDGSDLEIYHNGGNSFVRDLGTGNLVLDTNGISIVLSHSGNAEKMAEFFKNGPVELYHNNSKKAETTVNGFNAIGGLFIDSVEINAAYIQANQTTYSTADFVDSAYVATQIANLVDGAPTALDTLNELATALQNDSDALAALITVVDTKLNTAGVTTLVDSAYVQSRQTTYDFLDSAEAIALIATQGYLTDAIDSAATIALIQATVDSAYVAAREADAGGGGTDSATILALIQATVDSAYVAARDPGGAGGVTFRNYEYTADSGQTAFTGADTLGNSLAYTPNQLQVYRNGILLIDGSDYTATSSNTVTLTTASETGDHITVSTYTATVGATVSAYDYFADSGQTSFSGPDIDGNTLSFSGSNVFVHVNGLLLTDSNDYTRVGGSTITFDPGLDSGDIVSIIAISDLASEGGTDSAATIALIENTVDSAYIAARSAAGTDSATVENIIRSLVDSDYVFARQRSTTGLVFDAYSYTSDSAQTVFSGADNNNLTLHYNVGEIQVFRNGILLVDSDDYTASNGTSIILNSAAALNDNLSIASFASATNEIRMNEFEFTADSAQTIFIGIDDGGSTLSYNTGNILVHLNGILLSDSADYSAGNGTSITLNIGADSGDILHISSFSTPAETNLWREVTSTSYDAVAGTKLIVDASSSAVTVNLPTTASFGDEVTVIDGTGSSESNNITINRNGHKILGANSDFTIDVNRSAIDLVYYNATQGWIISGTS